ncbi:uncharacterized protein ACOB8E_011351 [Sarcophilus harrisii]
MSPKTGLTVAQPRTTGIGLQNWNKNNWEWMDDSSEGDSGIISLHCLNCRAFCLQGYKGNVGYNEDFLQAQESRHCHFVTDDGDNAGDDGKHWLVFWRPSLSLVPRALTTSPLPLLPSASSQHKDGMNLSCLQDRTSAELTDWLTEALFMPGVKG